MWHPVRDPLEVGPFPAPPRRANADATSNNSASYHATGGSPADSSSPPESHASPAGSDFGIPLPDGSHAAHLDANEVWDTMVDAVSSRGALSSLEISAERKDADVHVGGVGPDAHRTLIRRALVEKTFHFELRFHASVLHMRGPEVTEQPFESPEGDVLLWNGEIFDGLAVRTFRPSTDRHADAQRARRSAQARTTGRSFLTRSGGRARQTFSRRFGTSRARSWLPSPTQCGRPSLTRPHRRRYAFIYYQKVHNRIYFARDPLGRRSLLMHAPTSSCPFLVLSSNGPSADFPLKEWEEVECDAVHCYHLNDLKGKSWLVRCLSLGEAVASGC